MTRPEVIDAIADIEDDKVRRALSLMMDYFEFELMDAQLNMQSVINPLKRTFNNLTKEE